MCNRFQFINPASATFHYSSRFAVAFVLQLMLILVPVLFIGNKEYPTLSFPSSSSNRSWLQIIKFHFSTSAFASETSPLKLNRKIDLKNNRAPADKNISAEITVFTDKQKGKINKKIFGNNLSGYTLPPERSATGREWYGHSNYGTGIWNPKLKKANKEVIDLAKKAGITMMRFPGGHYSDYYNWKDTIGERTHNYFFGIDEFLKTCDDIGAEAVFTVNYLTGNARDAADLVEYLNTPNDGTNPNGGTAWAAERSKNAHPKPYNVKYFEIGNEVYDRVSSTSYGRRYIKFYDNMKAVDPTIQIGPVLHYRDYWNRSSMKIIKDKIDFGVIHTYITLHGGYGILQEKDAARMSAEEIFQKALCLPQIRYNWEFQKALNTIKTAAWKSIPLAITEYNSCFAQEKPVPYRHTLGNALVISEFLHLFLKPENNILMANYWGYCNGFFGMIKSNINFMKPHYKTPIWYIKRPNYYVFQLYNNHFGDVIVDHEVKSGTYNINKYDTYLENIVSLFLIGKGTRQNLLKKQWKTTRVAGITVSQNNDILEIDFKNPDNFNYQHTKKIAEVRPDTYYKLSGYIKTVDLKDKNGIYLAIRSKDLHGKHTPQKIKGTTDWIHCETVFRTLPITRKVEVVIRRLGNKGPLRGKAFFKDVKLEKFIPSISTDIPYLSVSTSISSDQNTVYLMVVNKDLEQNIKTKITLENFIPDNLAQTYTLWGNDISATNEKRPHRNVRIYTEEIPMNGNVFTTNLKKHSLTAIEISGHPKQKKLEYAFKQDKRP